MRRLLPGSHVHRPSPPCWSPSPPWLGFAGDATTHPLAMLTARAPAWRGQVLDGIIDKILGDMGTNLHNMKIVGSASIADRIAAASTPQTPSKTK